MYLQVLSYIYQNFNKLWQNIMLPAFKSSKFDISSKGTIPTDLIDSPKLSGQSVINFYR